MKEFIKNFSYTLTSNIISLVISALITFVVPKFLNVEDYGYFQLYLFYVGYVGFFHLGWCDGVFLRYAGAYYEKLNKRLLSSQFWLMTAFEAVVSLCIALVGVLCFHGEDKWFVIVCTGLSVIILMPKTLLLYVLQGTNRIKEYAFVTIIEKIVNIICVLLVLVLGFRNYYVVIGSDLIGKLFSLVYSMLACKEIIVVKPTRINKALTEAYMNIRAGINLMLANIASFLIIGIVRLAIERNWDIETFGKVSLTISVSNLLMVVIKAVANVMFPALKRLDIEKYSDIYVVSRDCLMIPLLGMLIFYYPVKMVLSLWLPDYTDSLKYMAMLFPICIYESKVTLLANTYLKALRKEKWLLFVNVLTVILSGLLSFLGVFVMNNLDFAILSIVILLGFRCCVSEFMLSKLLVDVQIVKEIIIETVMVITFIASSWCVGGFIGVIVYAIIYCIYILYKRNSLIELYKKIKIII